MTNHNPLATGVQPRLEVGPADRHGRRLVSMTLDGRVWRDSVIVTRYGDCIEALKNAADVLGVADADRFVSDMYQAILRAADRADIAAIARARADAGGDADDDDVDDVDVSMVARPECFFTPTVAGITVPGLTRRRGGDDHEPTPRWWMYVHYLDRRVERRRVRLALGRCLKLPDDRVLWFRPRPRPPAEPDIYTWSLDSQRAWLDGAPAPTAGDIYRDILTFLGSYLVFPPDERDVMLSLLALYTMLTYTTPVWQSVPYIHIVGTLGSGKTRVLELLRELVFRPHMTANASAAVVYRLLHLYGGTLLVDEADRLRRTNDAAVEDLLTVLNAGYRRGATASRAERLGDVHDPMQFQVFGPKIMAGTSDAHPSLASRCITVRMLRADADAPQTRARVDLTRAGQIRDGLYMWALEYADIIHRLPPVAADVCPADIGGRPFELWAPLLALASWVDEDLRDAGLEAVVYDRLLGYARSYTVSIASDLVPDDDQLLLQSLAELIAERDVVTVGDVLERARVGHPDRFRGWTARSVGSHLKRYGLSTRKLHGRCVFDAATVISALPDIERRYGLTLVPGIPPV